MSIQSNVNQMLSLGALLASQNPELKARAEARAKSAQLAREAEGYKKEIDIATKHGKAGKETSSEAQIKLAKNLKSQFENDPSEETFKEYQSARKKAKKAEMYLKNKREEKLLSREATKPLYTDLASYLEGQKGENK